MYGNLGKIKEMKEGRRIRKTKKLIGVSVSLIRILPAPTSFVAGVGMRLPFRIRGGYEADTG